MRCKACDKILTKEESIAKDPIHGIFYDLCSLCFYAGGEADKALEYLMDNLTRREDNEDG